MAKSVFRQMPAPLELSQQIPPPPGKSWDAKTPGRGQIFGANPRGCAGGMVMDEIDTCITTVWLETLMRPMSTSRFSDLIAYF